jgi:hypothetical protein
MGRGRQLLELGGKKGHAGGGSRLRSPSSILHISISYQQTLSKTRSKGPLLVCTLHNPRKGTTLTQLQKRDAGTLPLPPV